MGRFSTRAPNPVLESLLTKPLSEYTDLDYVPIQDMEPYVNRSVEIRIKELGINKPKRPCNHFVLYSMACIPRAEEWREGHCSDLPKGSRSLAAIISISWALESPSVKAKYKVLCQMELEGHGKAFPTYKFVRQPPRNKRKNTRLQIAALAALPNVQQIEKNAAIVQQPLPTNDTQDPSPYSSNQQLLIKQREITAAVAQSLPSPRIQDPVPFTPLTLQFPATVQSHPKELSPLVYQRLATLSGRCRDLEDFLKLCQKSELMRGAFYPTNKGLDYQLAVLEYNSFIASVHDILKHHVHDLKPYVPRVFDLLWEFDETFGMFEVSRSTWPNMDFSMDFSMPVSVSTPTPMPMNIDDFQLPLSGCEDALSADVGAAPSMDLDQELFGFEDNLAANPVLDLDLLDLPVEFSDEDLEKALQECTSASAKTADSEPAVTEPAVVNEPAQEEPVPLPDFTTIGALNENDLLLDQALSEAVDQEVDIMDFLNFDESKLPL